MASFAQFASDLDPATRRQLDRGARLVELLKQPETSPLAVEEQVAVLYAGTRGYLDSVAVNQVTSYEAALLEELRNGGKSVLARIRTEQKLTPEIEGELKSLLEAFSKRFSA